MSEKQNIENLFKDRFDNFKPEVDPSLWNNIAQQLPASTPVAHGIESGAKGLLKTLGIKTIVTAVTAVVVITTAIVYYATKENPVPTVNQPSTTEQAKNELSVIDNSTTSTISEVKQNHFKKTPSGTNAETVVTTNPVADNNSDNAISNDNGILQNQETSSPDNHQSGSKNNSASVDEKQTQPNTDHNKKERTPDENSSTSSATTQPPKTESECDKLKKSIQENYFSPNGDGLYDTFYLSELNGKISSLKVGIYQMGKLVYEWEGINGSWDGIMKDGSPASVGDYVCVYIFETKSGESCSGALPIRIIR